MKTKSIPLTVLAIGILSIIVISPIHANYQAIAYGRTDRSGYLPGDSGTLYITVRNEGSQALTVKNVTVDYPWMAFVTDHWDGNFTTLNVNQPVGTPGGTWNTQYSFTVPTDSRVYQNGEQASITIGTDIPNRPQGLYQTSATIVIAGATYQPLSFTTSIL